MTNEERCNLVDRRGKTWKPGAMVRYHQGCGHKEQYLEVKAGLYWYSGLGSGTLFLADGSLVEGCSPSEAQVACRQAGIEMWYVDSFIVSSFRSVMG